MPGEKHIALVSIIRFLVRGSSAIAYVDDDDNVCDQPLKWFKHKLRGQLAISLKCMSSTEDRSTRAHTKTSTEFTVASSSHLKREEKIRTKN